MGDLTRICRNCGVSFVFTEGEQAFYAERGYKPPAFCRDCRDARRALARPGDLDNRLTARPTYGAICSSCGEPTEVPFQPSPGRPVYCDDCFTNKRVSG